jgi:hypothetical protein
MNNSTYKTMSQFTLKGISPPMPPACRCWCTSVLVRAVPGLVDNSISDVEGTVVMLSGQQKFA